MKKLLTWEDHDASVKIMLALILALLVVSFIPIRIVVCIGLIGKFNKESTFYERRSIGNAEACKIEIRNFFLASKDYTFGELFEDKTE